jgi:glutathione S-transferase
MPAPYRLYGAELSPYTLKVRSVLRFKAVEHTYLDRNPANEADFRRFAKLPLIPVLVGSDDWSMQDSTPILETLEKRHGDVTILPADPALAFIAWLIEEYADEWVNKAMFHYRWSNPADQASAAARIAAMVFEGIEVEDRAAAEQTIATRMVPRLSMVGSNETTGPQIEASFHRLLRLLESHFRQQHAYLLGARPSVADFALAAQLQQLLSDPTPGAVMRAEAPRTVAWCEAMQMNRPRTDGDYETLEELEGTIADLLREEIGGVFLPWAAANAAAHAAGQPNWTADIAGIAWTQDTQKYSARTFGDIRRRRAAVGPHAALDALLERTGVDQYLLQDAQASEGSAESTDED